MRTLAGSGGRAMRAWTGSGSGNARAQASKDALTPGCNKLTCQHPAAELATSRQKCTNKKDPGIPKNHPRDARQRTLMEPRGHKDENVALEIKSARRRRYAIMNEIKNAMSTSQVSGLTLETLPVQTAIRV